MDYTTNLNLKKPDGEVDGDFVIVEDLNSNFDAIDTAVGDHIADTSNPHAVTKSQVGLGNCDNTADVNKNVLTATKLATARTISLTGDVTGSVSFDGSGNVGIEAAVADDSHGHVMGNVDGLSDRFVNLNRKIRMGGM